MVKIFLICPVREASEEDQLALDTYIQTMETAGNTVHYPARDTNQADPLGGWNICNDNCQALMAADEVHIYWTKKSQGSLFDIGVTFREIQEKNKKVILVNRSAIEQIILEEQKPKSFEHVLLSLANRS